jgi:hypothetical protein
MFSPRYDSISCVKQTPVLAENGHGFLSKVVGEYLVDNKFTGFLIRMLQRSGSH